MSALINLADNSAVYDVAKVSALSIASQLSKRFQNQIYLKREDDQVIHSFKLRGAYQKMSSMSEEQKSKGVIASSAGNHAQGVALGASKLHIKAIIVMPTSTPKIKVQAVEQLGAEVILHGDVYDDAFHYAKKLVSEQDLCFISPYDDFEVIAGQATVAKEILSQLKDIDYVFAPVGGGGLIKNQQLVDWKWVIDVSLWGVINGLHHFLPHLIEAEDSHVVSTASVAGLMAVPGLAPYNAAKYGVVAIMETLHHEMMRDEEANLGVSVLCPGVVRTNIATAQRNRPEHLRRQKGESGSNAAKAPEEARKRNSAIAAALENGMEPSDVASQVVNAIYDRRFWVLSHPELLGEINHRNQELAALKNPTLISDFT